MGLNLDLCQLLGLPERITCPRCKAMVASYFDDYDIECGHPNPSPGVWSIMCNCSECDHDWSHDFVVKADTTDEAMNERCAAEVMEEALNGAWQLLYPGKTDWRYPGQVVAHLSVEMNRRRTIAARLRLAADGLPANDPGSIALREWLMELAAELEAFG